MLSLNALAGPEDPEALACALSVGPQGLLLKGAPVGADQARGALSEFMERGEAPWIAIDPEAPCSLALWPLF